MRDFKSHWWSGSKPHANHLKNQLGVQSLCCSPGSNASHGGGQLRLSYFGFFFLEVGS